MSHPLRVLSLSTLFPAPDRPGFGRFVARQFDALVAQGGVELTVINPRPGLPFTGTARLDGARGYPVHHLPVATVPRFGVRWNPALIARAVLPLVRQMHSERPFDLVDAQFFYPDGPAAARVASALGLPLSIKARGSDIHYWGGIGFARTQMLAAADQAAGLLAVSQALKADMAALGMPESRIVVHYTGLDAALFRPRDHAETRARLVAETGLGVPPDAPLLLGVGNLIPLKGHDFAIRALNAIPDAHLAIAGTGPEEAQLHRIAQQLGLADRVHLLGGVVPERLAEWLAAADLFVLPSEREGLANAWLEALSSGTPLVITAVGGAREVVDRPAAGRLVARDPDAIAAAVRELLTVPPSPAEVAACAARFSWEANAAQLAEHYRRLAGR